MTGPELELEVVVHDNDHVSEARVAETSTETFESQNRIVQLKEYGEIMNKLTDHFGDGLARVSVSADLATSDYGNKAGSMVTVTVTCNNNERDISAVAEIGFSLAQRLVTENQQEMQAVLEARLNGETIKTKPDKATKRSLGKVRSPAKAAPNFRRG